MYLFKTPLSPPLTYISSGRFVSGGTWIHKRRNIDSFVVLVGIEGTAFIEQNGEQYELSPDSVLILLPHMTHSGYKISEASVSYYWCHFYCSNPYSLTNIQNASEFYLPNCSDEAGAKINDNLLLPIYSKCVETASTHVLFHQLLHISNSDYFTPFGANYLLTLLMIDLTQQHLSKYLHSFKKDEKDKKFEEILEWIRINTATNISVSHIAKRFNYNSDYLSRLFRQRIGVNLQEYIHDMKISKAKAMLVYTDVSVKEVAYSLGFNDEKYFMKLFKEHEDLTPTQYRNTFCNTHLNDH